MANTSPIKAVQNGLRKHNLTQSASAIREAATALELDINQDASVELLINYFVEHGQGSAIAQTSESTETVNQEQLDMLPSAEPASLVNYQETTEMVQAQAQEMGVVLSADDIQKVSETISGQTTDADEINAEIREAISHFIQFHKAQSLNKVSTLVRDVYREQSEANREVSQALASGLQQFSRDMEAQRNHTKSTFRTALKCFAIPGTEA